MALKKRPSVGASMVGTEAIPSVIRKHQEASLTTKQSSKPARLEVVETIEARLERKATLADAKTFATDSLGQMTREKRHKLLYGD